MENSKLALHELSTGTAAGNRKEVKEFTWLLARRTSGVPMSCESPFTSRFSWVKSLISKRIVSEVWLHTVGLGFLKKKEERRKKNEGSITGFSLSLFWAWRTYGWMTARRHNNSVQWCHDKGTPMKKEEEKKKKEKERDKKKRSLSFILFFVTHSRQTSPTVSRAS